MPKCQIYPDEDAICAWQPFGPEDDYRQAFTALGSHYRGFPVLHVGQRAYDEIKAGRAVRFVYRGVQFVANGKEVIQFNEQARRAEKELGKP